MNKKINIGSRGSKLALIYAQNAKDKIIQSTNLKDEDIIITVTVECVLFVFLFCELNKNLKYRNQRRVFDF